MLPGETAKQRAKRIDKHVLDGPRWFDRGRSWLGCLVLLATVGGWGLVIAFRCGEASTSPGQLAAVHATWANDCNACHTPFQPLGADALLASSATRAAADQKCQKCHSVAHAGDPLGPFGHHAVSGALSQLGCTSCHHEHGGTGQSLVRTADNDCTACHARDDLIQFVVGKPALADIGRVSRFSAEGHPYFRSLGDPTRGPGGAKSYPRQLKFAQFSHHLHLTAGMAQDSGHLAMLTLGQLSEADQIRYGKTGRSPSENEKLEPVQLSCGSCHQPDSGRQVGAGVQLGAERPAASVGEQPATTGPPTEPDPPGVYFLPIVYEQHCQACHPLAVKPGVAIAAASAIASQGPRHGIGPDGVVQHRLTQERLAEELEQYWEDRYFKEHPELLVRKLPLPGHSATAEDEDARQWIRNGFQESLANLNHVCGECHRLLEPRAGQRPASGGELTSALQIRVAPVEIPSQWLEYARFDHAAHRATSCRRCHQDAYTDAGLAELPAAAEREEPAQSPLMIANRDTCLECHGPQEGYGDDARGGARFDCAECHRYHNRQSAADMEASGLAAPPR